MPVRIAIAAAVLLAGCAAALIFTMRDTAEPSHPPVVLTQAGPEVAAATPDEAAPPRPADPEAFFTRTEGRPVPPQDPFLDGSGAAKTLADFKGRPVVLNFWATWCAPCVKELPSLARLQAARPDLAVLIVNVEKKGARVAAPFLEENGVEGLEPYVDGEMKLWRAFRLNGLPTTVLIDAEGREVARHEGEADWDTPEVQAEIDGALK